MKCKKCGEENILKANYCKACGQPFTDEERESAYNKTIYGKIDKLLDLQGWLDLSNITGNIFLRIGVIFVLGILVVMNITKNGNDFIIKNSDQYTIAYHEQFDEYYLFTNLDEVSVSLYAPKQTEQITFQTHQMNDALKDEVVIDADDQITVTANENEYYVLTVTYTDGTDESIKFYVGKDA